jgi:hypothetical protein
MAHRSSVSKVLTVVADLTPMPTVIIYLPDDATAKKHGKVIELC